MDYIGANGFNPPYTVDQIQWRASAWNPASVKVDSYTLRFFERALYQRLSYFLKYNGMPLEWNKDYLNYAGLVHGYCGVLDAASEDGIRYGVIPQWGTLSGYGIYRQPTRLSVVNAFINRPQMRIGRDCEILKFTDDYRGLWDVVEFYAVKLALAAKVYDMNMLTSRSSHIVAAKTKQAAQTLKAAEDRAQSGEPLVIVDEKMLCPDDPASMKSPFQVLDYDVKNGFIAPEALDVIRSLYSAYDTEVGIPNANLSKKERMSVSEVNENNGETYSRIQIIIDNLNRSFERVNKLYPEINMSVSIRGEDAGNVSSDNATEPADV